MPKEPCAIPRCPRFATGRGMCNLHRREYEREASRRRFRITQGYDAAVARRDADPDYRYPKRGAT